jgi:nucleotide-binding universal stress UspA family protein
MVKFTHVLYPTDISSAALPAFAYAVSIARWYQARLTVLHVVPTFDAVQMAPDAIGELTHVVYPPTQDAVTAEVRRTLNLDQVEGVDVHVMSVEGDAAPAILDHALSQGTNLIVMGTHGRRGFDRLLHGSVTERVLQRAHCPVLTIPPHAALAPDAAIFSRILCPIDFSPASQQAYGFALDLASQSNGAVTALHVIEWLADQDPAPYAGFNIVDYQQHLVADAEARLRSFTESEPHPWCEVEPIIASGRSHREILKAAETHGADLIVMGAQGRGGIGLTMFGSTTQQVVRAAECPILVVRLV